MSILEILAQSGAGLTLPDLVDQANLPRSSVHDLLVTLEGVSIASIGPATSETVRQHGLAVTAEARPYTIDGLLNALLQYV